MERFVALLRGVNVNGITVKSAELAELFRSLGFEGVRTVLASGNVVFETDARDEAALKATIEAALGDRFGYDAWIVLVTQDHLAAAVAAYPFPEEEAAHPYVVFTSDADVLADITAVAAELAPPAPGSDAAGSDASTVERAQPGEGVLYWQCPRGSSTDTPLAKALARARYKATATTRNLRTLRKLL